jgi:hypothetical protein
VAAEKACPRRLRGQEAKGRRARRRAKGGRRFGPRPSVAATMAWAGPAPERFPFARAGRTPRKGPMGSFGRRERGG